MTEYNGLTRAPLFIVDSRTVLGSDRAHGSSPGIIIKTAIYV